MYAKNQIPRTSINQNGGYKGEAIEAKIRRMMNNKEPMSEGAELIYTEREEGVQAAYDIRTDRFEIACEAKDKIAQRQLTAREQRLKEKTYDTMSETEKQEFHTKFPESKIKPMASTGGESKT